MAKLKFEPVWRRLKENSANLLVDVVLINLKVTKSPKSRQFQFPNLDLFLVMGVRRK